MSTICPEVLDEMIQHATQNYPGEACGILIGEAGQDSVTDFFRCENIYDEMKKRDPKNFPRDSKTAYFIDPQDVQRIGDEARGEGKEIKAIVHSHTDHDAYFSEEDRLIAAPWGEPMFPGISYIVISVWNGKFKEANEFFWDGKKKDFVCRGLIH